MTQDLGMTVCELSTVEAREWVEEVFRLHQGYSGQVSVQCWGKRLVLDMAY